MNVDNARAAAVEAGARKATPMSFALGICSPLVRGSVIWPGRPGEDKVPKLAKFRIGVVTVRELAPGKWQLRFGDPQTRRNIRKRIIGLPRGDIEAMARHISGEAYAGKGLSAAKPKAPTIHGGLCEALGLRNVVESTARARAGAAARFETWLAEQYSGVETWADLKPAHLQAYMLGLERAGLARDTIRNAIEPIRLTWRHLSANYADLVRPCPQLKIKTEKIASGIEALECAEVAALLGWLKENRPSVWPICALQALAGLRIYEAAYLRSEDCDLAAGSVRIQANDLHRPKNAASWRTIPLCQEALAALRRAMADPPKVRSVGDWIFTSQRGDPWKPEALSHRMTACFRAAAKALGAPRLKQVPARRLRAFFATTASRLGVPDWLLKAYLGHSSGDVLGQHYRKIKFEDLRAVSAAIENWRGLSGETGQALTTV